MNALGGWLERCSGWLGLGAGQTSAVAPAPQDQRHARDEFRRRCTLWAAGASPAADDEQAKVAFAKGLTAPELDACLIEVASWDPETPDIRKLSLMAFVFAGLMCQVSRGAEFAEAVVRVLAPSGPPLLVDMWGEARDCESAQSLLAALDLNDASAELQIAVAGALITARAEAGVPALRQMQQRAQSAEAAREIDVALQQLDRTRASALS